MPSKKSKPRAKKSKPKPVAVDQACVAQVFLWVVQGHTEATITEAIRAQWPEADARRLIVAALEQVEKSAAVGPEMMKGWCLEAYRELHRRMIEMGDYAGAVRAVSKINDLLRVAAKDTPTDPAAECATCSQARAYLAGLVPNGDTMPLGELARLVVQKVVGG